MDRVSETLRRHYEQKFQQYGPSSLGVDWGNDKTRQELRYDKMLNIIAHQPSEVPTVLDVGCGYAGLLQYANQKGICLKYTGIDVAENMIAYAREAFPAAVLIAGDILKASFAQRFQYVVCNGVLTQKLDVPGLVMDAFASRLIRKLFELCDKGAAFNVMTTKVNYFSNHLYYRNPAELLSWCMTEITPYVSIDHSYPLFEFTMYLFRPT